MAVFLDGRPYSMAFVMGMLFHVAFLKNIELDIYIPQFITASICATIALSFERLFLVGLSVPATIQRVAAEEVSFILGLFTCMVVYRLFFHRIQKFPGPLGARISRFYALYLSAKNIQYYVELEKLHKQYGDFIRTGPREICVVRKSAIPLVLGFNSRCSRSTWFNQKSRKCENGMIAFSRDVDDHKRRKRAWDRGLGGKALGTYQPRIKSQVDQLVRELQKSAGTPMDATAWMRMLAFDLMGQIGFSKDFGSVTSGEDHPAAKAINDHMTILGLGTMVPWLLYLMQFVPRAFAGYMPFIQWCASMIREKKLTWDSEKPPQDISSWLIKAVVEKDSSAPPTEAALDDDARAIIIAGSDTSSSANACTLYFLAKHPEVLQKLQQKLDAAMPYGAQDWAYSKVKSVTYLDDIINESLRLKPPVASGSYRVTPAEGLQIDESFVPGDVNIFIPVQIIQTDKRYWQQPLDFIPERWGERKAEMGTDEVLFLPFSAGIYKCVGSQLAMMGMRITISCIAQQFDITFAPGETGAKFDKDKKDVFTSVLPPLQLLFTPRKK